MTRHAWGSMPTAQVRRSTGCFSSSASPSTRAGGAGRSSRAVAWTAFWREQGEGSHCLANLHPQVRHALSRHWSRFAARLAPCSRILDIGCGAGIVGHALLAARDDLRIAGIDLAGVPAPGDRRIELLSGTQMEDLPFADNAFDAAVSQFGFEYGDLRPASREMARVLVPGAPFSFIVHHAMSSFVQQSLARQRALRDLLGAPVRRAFLAADAVELERQTRSIRRAAPAEALVVEVGQALRARLGRGDAQRSSIWDAVADALAPEREILDALATACVAPRDLDRWLTAFAGRFEIRMASALRRPSGEVFAWKIEGVKTAVAFKLVQPRSAR